jgi:hypothetical protein
MQENYLHYVWQFQYFNKKSLKTAQGDRLTIISPGIRNEHAGPDFLNSSLLINHITWHGHVELHVKASDWKAHKHQEDPAYANVILHVVWESDQNIEREDHTIIPSLVLQDKVSPQLWEKYQQLAHTSTKIPCANQIDQVASVIKIGMLDRALFKRLSNKNSLVYQLLENNQGDWEATAYQLLAYNFGFKLNKQPFLALSLSLPWKLVVKHAANLIELEALLLGQAGLLSTKTHLDDTYLATLLHTYNYLGYKYNLMTNQLQKANWRFFRTRPGNFPTIRIAQFAQLLHQNPHIFHFLIHSPLKKLIKHLSIKQSAYWQRHYQFGKPILGKIPSLGTTSIENILINTVTPLLVAYGKHQDEVSYIDQALEMLQNLPAEKNKITQYWKELAMPVKTAFDSQALIELFNNFCSAKRCLQCNIGIKLMQQEN